MCLAIFKPAKLSVSEDTLRTGWIRNPDGAGYAFAHKGRIHMRKGFTVLKDFLDAYKKDEKKLKNCPAAIHFRIRSSGAKSPENTHPFEIEDGVMIHNGNIDGTAAVYGDGPCDTSLFASMFSKDLTFKFCSTNLKELDLALAWNKLVLLYKDGSHVIVNEEKGHWENGIWLSSARAYVAPSPAPVESMYGGTDREIWGYD